MLRWLYSGIGREGEVKSWDLTDESFEPVPADGLIEPRLHVSDPRARATDAYVCLTVTARSLCPSMVSRGVGFAPGALERTHTAFPRWGGQRAGILA